MNILLIRYLMQSFQMTILHIIINGCCPIEIKQILIFYKYFNIAFDFPWMLV